MLDHDLDDINAAFAELRTIAAAQVTPPGMGPARAAARRRRKRAMVMAVVIAILVLGVPVATYSGFRLDAIAVTGQPSPKPHTSTGAPVPLPTSRGNGGFCPPPSTAAPAGGITEQALCNGTLDVPAWPAGGTACPSGRVTFTDGLFKIDSDDAITLGAVDGQSPDGKLPIAYTSALGDGRVDAVVQINCEAGGALSQVLVLRPGADGFIQTVGVVAATNAPVKWIFGCQVLAGGDIGVDVGDYANGDYAQRQRRTYRWDGTAFAQVGGPTTFPANPRLGDLSATATDLVIQAPAKGASAAEMSIVVREAGPAGGAFTLTVDVPVIVHVDRSTRHCQGSPVGDGQTEITCKGTIAAGQTRTVVLHLTTSAQRDSTVDYQPTADVYFSHADMTDVDDSNDTTSFELVWK